jgi:hypothetical protein
MSHGSEALAVPMCIVGADEFLEGGDASLGSNQSDQSSGTFLGDCLLNFNAISFNNTLGY